MKTKTFKTAYLTRVEGEGSLHVKLRNGQVTQANFKIFEPPRLFEAFLRGRDFREAPDITARICGICPVAYQMSSVNAMEAISGVKVDGQLRALRRLLYCGEWIESHVLHIYFLHAPDFLGYDDALQVAKMHPDVVKRALLLKKCGNDIVSLLGGREIHPINVRVGGFYRVPTKRELASLIAPLETALEIATEMVHFVARLPFPDLEQDYEFVSLVHPSEYPLHDGRIASSKGLDIGVQQFDEYFEEEHVPHSNALHARIKGRGAYMVGPMARFNLNFERLTPTARDLARSVGLDRGCRNPFKSIIVRSIETVFAIEEALNIIREYEPPASPAIEVSPRSGVGYGASEAPRGTLVHRYSLDEKGQILDAKIVPPTSQNQKMIEDDLKKFVKENINLPEDELTLKCEQVIRNYDPCISCATHFLKLTLEME